jgi:hypothetical protein
MQSKSLRKPGMRLCGNLCQRASPKAKARPRHHDDSRIQDRYYPQDDSEDESSTPRSRISRIKARSKYLRGIQQLLPKFFRTHNAMSAATTGGRGST